MRTLQFGMGWFPEETGGLNRVYYNLVRNLPNANVEVKGLVAGNSLPRLGDAADERCDVRTFADSGSSLIHRWRMARRSTRQILSETDIGVAVSHFALYTFPVLDQIKSMPLVVHFHGPWALEGATEGQRRSAMGVKRFIERSVYKRAERYIVLSNAFGDILHRLYSVEPDKITVVPGGVDISTFAIDLTQDAARDRLGWPRDRRILLTVRRLARRMGLENLIAAIKQIEAKHEDLVLFIAGKGHLYEELNQIINSYGLQERVKLLGFVEDADLPVMYRAADFSIVPTASLEGFGLITIESLAAGTPVLVTPVGGLPEVVRELSDGLVLPGSAVNDLANGLNAVLNEEISLPTENECSEYARKRFDWKVIAARVHDVYRGVLQ